MREWLSQVGRDLNEAEASLDQEERVDALLFPHVREGYKRFQAAGMMDERGVQDIFNYLDRMNGVHGFGFRPFHFLSFILRDLSFHQVADKEEILRLASQATGMG